MFLQPLLQGFVFGEDVMLKSAALVLAVVAWLISAAAAICQTYEERDYSGVAKGAPGIADMMSGEDYFHAAEFAKCSSLFTFDDKYKAFYYYDNETGTVVPRPGFGYDDLDPADQVKCALHFHDKTTEEIVAIAKVDAAAWGRSIASGFTSALIDLRSIEEVNAKGDAALPAEAKAYNDVYTKYLLAGFVIGPGYDKLTGAMEFMERFLGQGIYIPDQFLFGEDYGLSFDTTRLADEKLSSKITLFKKQADGSFAEFGDYRTLTDAFGDQHTYPVLKLPPYAVKYEWIEVLEVHPEIHKSDIFSSGEYAAFPTYASAWGQPKFCKLKVEEIVLKNGRWGFNAITAERFEFYYAVDAVSGKHNEVWAKLFVAFPNSMQLADPAVMAATCNIEKVLTNGGAQPGRCTCVMGLGGTVAPPKIVAACGFGECHNACIANEYELGIWEGDQCSKDGIVIEIPIPPVRF